VSSKAVLYLGDTEITFSNLMQQLMKHYKYSKLTSTQATWESVEQKKGNYLILNILLKKYVNI